MWVVEKSVVCAEARSELILVGGGRLVQMLMGGEKRRREEKWRRVGTIKERGREEELWYLIVAGVCGLFDVESECALVSGGLIVHIERATYNMHQTPPSCRRASQ